MSTDSGVRRVNFKLATDSFESLQKLSTTSGCNMTELVETALALLSEAYATQEAGGQIILTNKAGQPSKALQLPTKPLRSVILVNAPSIVAQGPAKVAQPEGRQTSMHVETIEA